MVTRVSSFLTCEVEDVLKSETQQNQSVGLVRKKEGRLQECSHQTLTQFTQTFSLTCSLSTGQSYYF